MGLGRSLPWVVLLAGVIAAACEDDPSQLSRRNAPSGGASEPPPGGALADEQFPPELLEPYTGPAIDVYDNTAVGYMQLRARVKQLFADDGIGGNTDQYFATKIALLGGADFVTQYNEARVATPDFLLALDGVAKDACGRAATNKTGPFAGSDPENVPGGGEGALVTQLYQRLLLRAPSAQEVTDAVDLVATLKPLSPSNTSAWAGVCEALVRHQDFIFTLPPSVASLTGADKERMQLVKIANDFAGRPPTDGELSTLIGKSVGEKLDYYFGTNEFRDFYFHRTRVRTESTGSAEADEAARLWTYLVTTGSPMQELLTADYTVDSGFQKIPRGPEHGATGVLTMPGFIKPKPGFPHYNYAARVLSDFLGQIFEVTPEILAARQNATATSTVQPGSSCIACHGLLTPLEYQRLRWADDGTYRTTDEKGAAIDDSDHGLVPDYPFKGAGMASFAQQAVRKEKFFRQTFQSQYLFFFGRQMRYSQDERTVYLALWKSAWNQNGNFKELLKVMANVPSYLGQ